MHIPTTFSKCLKQNSSEHSDNIETLKYLYRSILKNTYLPLL
jgi:hypothetical protein